MRVENKKTVHKVELIDCDGARTLASSKSGSEVVFLGSKRDFVFEGPEDIDKFCEELKKLSQS